jgi:polymorphic membrane protein
LVSRPKILRLPVLVLQMAVVATLVSLITAGPASAVNSCSSDPSSVLLAWPGAGQRLVNYDNVTLNGCTISGLQSNTSNGDSGYGGAIENRGTLYICNSTISNNIAQFDGGGIYNAPQGTLKLTNVVVTGNTAGGTGGGIENAATLTMSNVTATANTAGSGGGGIANLDGSVAGVSLTVANNTTIAGDGGGILTVNGSFCLSAGDPSNCLSSAAGSK